MDPTGAYTAFDVGSDSCDAGFCVSTEVGALVTGPDGRIWFSDDVVDEGPHSGSVALWVGSVDTSGNLGVFVYAGSPEAGSGITVGPESNIWFLGQWGNEALYTPTTGASEFGAVSLLAAVPGAFGQSGRHRCPVPTAVCGSHRTRAT